MPFQDSFVAEENLSKKTEVKNYILLINPKSEKKNNKFAEYHIIKINLIINTWNVDLFID